MRPSEPKCEAGNFGKNLKLEMARILCAPCVMCAVVILGDGSGSGSHRRNGNEAVSSMAGPGSRASLDALFHASAAEVPQSAHP